MPSTVSHALVAVAAGSACAPRNKPHLFWLSAIICATIADVDLVGSFFGIPYAAFFGHRGFTHSLFFGLLLSILLTAYLLRDTDLLSRRWRAFFLFFFLLSATHGLLDACTDGSIGVALLSPFDTTRYFFPWTPISMGHFRRFLRTWSFAAIESEFFWVWLPAVSVILLSWIVRLGVRRSRVKT